MKRIIAASALALSLAGCGAGSAAQPIDDIELRGVAFSPAEMTVDVGTEVTWINQDDVDLHTVTSGEPQKQGIPGVKEGKPSRPDGVFDHDFTQVGDEFSFTFEEAGTFVYFCEVHAGMTGTIVVRA